MMPIKKLRMTHKERNGRREKMAKFAASHSPEQAALKFGVSLATVYLAIKVYGKKVSK